MARDCPYSKVLSLLAQGRETEAQVRGPPPGLCPLGSEATNWAKIPPHVHVDPWAQSTSQHMFADKV